MSSTVKIVTDSACDLPDDIVSKYDIEIVPLTVRFGDEEFVDRVELSTAEFWKRMRASNELPATAAPSLGAFEKAFRSALDEGAAGVVCVCLSDKLSATHQAAVKAAAEIGDERIVVIDSMLCTVGLATLCIEAAELSTKGEDAASTGRAVVALRDSMEIYGALDTLDNLRKGGRIGAAGAFFGSLLSVKPLITFKEGEVRPESRQRTRIKAVKHLVDIVRNAGPVHHVGVAHSEAADYQQFLTMIREVVGDQPILETNIGPVIGTHGGQGIVAVTFSRSKR